jgi:hypothetical protein
VVSLILLLADQPWIALTLCDNSDGEWAPCSQKGDPTTLQPGSFCSCTDAAKTTVAFSDANSLTQFASLPRSTGQSIAFEAGHTPSGNPTEPASSDPRSTGGSPGSATGGSKPTASVAVTTTRVNSEGSTEVATETQPALIFSTTDSAGRGTVVTSAVTQTVTNGSPIGATNTDTSSSNGGSSSSSGLASGAKIGIGVGVAAAALLLIALLAFMCLRRRKRRQLTPSVVESVGTRGNEKKSADSLTTPPVPEIAGQPVSEADGRVANPSNVRSELDGTNYFSAMNMNAQRREGPIEQVREGSGAEQQYVAYRPPPPQEPQAVAELPAVKTPPETGAR